MHSRRFVVLSLIVFIFSAGAAAGPFTWVVAYGDSLSDNGNMYAATGQPPAPYYQGRYSNGPVAVEDLAAQLGAPLMDLAWAGATTGIGNEGDGGTPTTLGAFSLPGMETVFNGSLAAVAPLAPSALFVVWGGPNDFLSPAPEDGGDYFKVADRAVGDLMSMVIGLKGIGVQHILVPGMPDLGLTPYFQSMGQGASGSFLTDYFNAKLAAELAPTGAIYYDTAGLMRDVVANPAKYGFTNVTDACFTGTTICGSPNSYLFFDDFHPSAHAHAIIADEFAQSAVPEPATYILVTSALAVVAVARRMRR